MASTSDDSASMASTPDDSVSLASTPDDSVSMASTSVDFAGMASTSDGSDMASTSDGSDMASPFDESAMGTGSCSTSQKAKRKKDGKAAEIIEAEAIVARIMWRVERNKKLMKYVQTGEWDGGIITYEDHLEMKEEIEYRKRQKVERHWRHLALKRRVVDSLIKWIPLRGRFRGAV